MILINKTTVLQRFEDRKKYLVNQNEKLNKKRIAEVTYLINKIEDIDKMARKFIKNKQLLNLGFIQVDNKTQTEDGILYDWFQLTKNDAKIEVAKEYGYKGKCVLQTLFFNNVQLTKFNGFGDVVNLIKII